MSKQKVQRVRVWVERENGYMQPRGLALLVSGGDRGSTYGEPGRDFGATLSVTLVWWTWCAHATWKVVRPADTGSEGGGR